MSDLWTMKGIPGKSYGHFLKLGFARSTTQAGDIVVELAIRPDVPMLTFPELEDVPVTAYDAVDIRAPMITSHQFRVDHKERTLVYANSGTV